jgi:hypothetical protein
MSEFEYQPKHAKRNILDCLEEYALPIGLLTGAILGAAIVFALAALKII